jgi:fructoselysine-6-P-deglycase FrlB-like protein
MTLQPAPDTGMAFHSGQRQQQVNTAAVVMSRAGGSAQVIAALIVLGIHASSRPIRITLTSSR